MFQSTVLICCVFITLTPYMALSMTDEQKAKIHEHFEMIGMECIKDYPITEDDINNLRAKKLPISENGPCFLACVMKKIGVMDDKGMLQKDTALDLAKKVFEDPEELKNIEDFLHSCAHVNTEQFGDGDKGCERAVNSVQCMLDNASKFGLEL